MRWLRPSTRASLLFMIAAKGGWRGSVARSLLITLHSCDVAEGAILEGPPILPHPFGIVIGRGVRLGTNVKIWQGVTLGSDGRSGYPTIGPGCRLLPYSTVVGRVVIGSGALIGAHVMVSSSIVENGVVRSKPYVGDGEARLESPRALHGDLDQ